MPQREEGREEERVEEIGKWQARRSRAHLLEGAERVHLRGAHAPARKAAGCTCKEDAQRLQ